MNEPPALEDYWRALANALPDFPPAQQHLAVALYRELARGAPLTDAQLATALGVTLPGAREALAQEPVRSFVYRQEGRIAGFGGLATAPMHHEFVVEGRTLWTWCAWDSLFIPAVLDATAEVSSPDPQSGEPVRLRVSPGGILQVEPVDALVSFLLPAADSFDESAENLMAAFCHHVFFFASSASAERWRASHGATFFYSPAEAFELGQRLVSRQFGNALRCPPVVGAQPVRAGLDA